MIIILSISDLLYNVIAEILEVGGLFFSPNLQLILGYTLAFAINFSTYWAASIAYLVYQSISLETRFIPEKYCKWSLLIISLSSLITILMNEFTWAQSQIVSNLIESIPLLISVTITTIYYLKSITVLKKSPISLRTSKKLIIRNLYSYSLVQLLLVGPAVVFSSLDNSSINNFNVIAGVLLNLTGFANFMVYFFQRRSSLQKEEPKNEYISL